MFQLSTTTKLVAILSFSFFAISIALVGGVGYLVHQKSSALTLATSERLAQELEYTELSAIAKMVENTKEDREALEKYVLDDSKVIGFLSSLESVGKNMGLSVNTTNVDTAEDGKDALFEQLKLQLTARGRKSDLQSYVAYLEGLPYQVTINQLNLSQSSAGTGEWSLSVQLYLTKLTSAE